MLKGGPPALCPAEENQGLVSISTEGAGYLSGTCCARNMAVLGATHEPNTDQQLLAGTLPVPKVGLDSNHIHPYSFSHCPCALKTSMSAPTTHATRTPPAATRPAASPAPVALVSQATASPAPVSPLPSAAKGRWLAVTARIFWGRLLRSGPSETHTLVCFGGSQHTHTCVFRRVRTHTHLPCIYGSWTAPPSSLRPARPISNRSLHRVR
jgi:hypothetical protein